MHKLSIGALVAAVWLSAVPLSADTITFDEFPATNNNVALTVAYAGLGVTFGPTNSGTWGGLSNGDPGNWHLEGTNGPQFLGFNGINGYGQTVSFDTPVSSVSLDFSRSAGSSDGIPCQPIILLCYWARLWPS